MALRHLLIGGGFSALAATLPALDLAPPAATTGHLRPAPAPAAVIWTPHMSQLGRLDASSDGVQIGASLPAFDATDLRSARMPPGLPQAGAAPVRLRLSASAPLEPPGLGAKLPADDFEAFLAGSYNASAGMAAGGGSGVSTGGPWGIVAGDNASSAAAVPPQAASGTPRNPGAGDGPRVPGRGAMPLPAAIAFSTTAKGVPFSAPVEVPLSGSALHLGLGLGLLALLAGRGRPGAWIRRPGSARSRAGWRRSRRSP